MSLVNNNLKQFSLCQLIDRMAKHEVFGSRQELEQLFGFKNRQFSLTVGSEQFSIPL